MDIHEASHTDALREFLGGRANAQKVCLGQRDGREDARRVTRVNARFLDVLHDATKKEILAVVQRINVNLNCVIEELVDEQRGARRVIAHIAHARPVVLEVSPAVDNFHAAPAKHIRRAHQHGVTNTFGDLNGLVDAVGGSVLRRRQIGRIEHGTESPPVFSVVDGLGARTEDRNPSVGEALRQTQWRLATQLNEHSLDRAHRFFGLVDRHDVLKGERLKVEAVRGVVVGRNGLGIAVDHDRLVAILERERGVDARVVELDALADAVGARSQDDDRFPRPRLDLVLNVVTAVVIRRARLELGGACVDRLEDRDDAMGHTRGRHLGLVDVT